MYPTIDQQLQGAQRLLDAVAADEGMSATSAEMIVNIGRLLRRVRGSWAELLPFYREDNRLLEELLSNTVDSLPPESTLIVRSGLANDDVDDHIAAVSERNRELRGLLSHVIREIPASNTAEAVRDRVGEYLRARVATDPS